MSEGDRHVVSLAGFILLRAQRLDVFLTMASRPMRKKEIVSLLVEGHGMKPDSARRFAERFLAWLVENGLAKAEAVASSGKVAVVWRLTPKGELVRRIVEASVDALPAPMEVEA